MHLKCVETYIKTRVLTICCCAGSCKEGVMEDIERNKCANKIGIKTKLLTFCCCAGSGEEGVMEDVKRDVCAHKVDGHMHKNKTTYFLLLCR